MNNFLFKQKTTTVAAANSAPKKILIGMRVPRDYFKTTGVGESDIQIHAGSYHLALKEAGIERFNIMTYSSIMPGTAREISRPEGLTHGAVMETITAAASATKGKRATAGIIYGWLYDKITGVRYGGLVCEYNGNMSEKEVSKSLRMSLDELYFNGFLEQYELKEINLTTRSVVPKKKFGTALVAICFVNYEVPMLE
jgi:arginine decarboxylase